MMLVKKRRHSSAHPSPNIMRRTGVLLIAFLISLGLLNVALSAPTPQDDKKEEGGDDAGKEEGGDEEAKEGEDAEAAEGEGKEGDAEAAEGEGKEGDDAGKGEGDEEGKGEGEDAEAAEGEAKKVTQKPLKVKEKRVMMPAMVKAKKNLQ